MDPGGLSEANAAAIRDSVTSVLDAFRELASSPDPMAVGSFCPESPSFRIYENGALHYESVADLHAADLLVENLMAVFLHLRIELEAQVLVPGRYPGVSELHCFGRFGMTTAKPQTEFGLGKPVLRPGIDSSWWDCG